MGFYKFTAISACGQKITGVIDGESVLQVQQKLLQRQLNVVSLKNYSQNAKPLQMNKKQLLSFTLEMTRLLQAGLPIYETLAALEEKHRGQKYHPLLIDLSENIRSGKTLSQGICKHNQIFDLLYVSMVANAEKTGKLEECLHTIANLLQRQIQLKKQIVSALLYPSLLASFCLVIMSCLLFYVVPSLKELFDGKDLHPLTKFVFSLSDFALNHRWILLAGLFVVGCCIFGFVTSGYGRLTAKKWVVKIPFLKKILAKIAIVRFCRASSALIDGGLTAVVAFKEAKFVMDHPVLENIILEAEVRISHGEFIHSCFENQSLIPPLVPRMLAIAEQSGKLSFMLGQIADIYEEEIQTFFLRFTSLVQPCLLLLLAVIIGFVLLAVLLPLTDVSSFVS